MCASPNATCWQELVAPYRLTVPASNLEPRYNVTMWPVSRRVNKVGNDNDATLIEPLAGLRNEVANWT